MPDAPNTYLHIPNKDWSPDYRESENYREIERWARGLTFGATLPGAGFNLSSGVAIGSGSNSWLGTSGGWSDSGQTSDTGGLSSGGPVGVSSPGFYMIHVWLDCTVSASGASGFAIIFRIRGNTGGGDFSAAINHVVYDNSVNNPSQFMLATCLFCTDEIDVNVDNRTGASMSVDSAELSAFRVA